MSDREPTQPYVYQPGAVTEGERIYGVAGPGTERYRNERFTKAEAEEAVKLLRQGKMLRRYHRNRRDGA